jgi:Flp pilus assembly pilin Flp
MPHLLVRFAKEEDGAVTVDWVVLTAAIIGIGLLVLVPVGLGTNTLADAVGDMVGSTAVGVEWGG